MLWSAVILLIALIALILANALFVAVEFLLPHRQPQ